MNTALVTPSKLYAASRPYSFLSPPCIGLFVAVFSKKGTPNVSINSFWLVILNALLAFDASVPAAVAVPAAFILFSAVATTIRGVVPGSAGV